MATSWTFSTTRELIAWMQDEYLSQLTLEGLKVTPKRGVPRQVEFVWRLHGLGNGQTQPYRVVATGVRRFERAGSGAASDEGEVSFADVDLDADGVTIAMAAPCRIALTCDQVVLSRGRKTKKLKQNRPPTDYAYFSLTSEGVLTLPQLLAAVGAPAAAALVGNPPIVDADAPARAPHVGFVDIVVDGTVWVMFYTRPTTAPVATDITMCRKGCSDAEWHRVQQLPRAYPSSQVSSSWEFDSSGADWLQLVGPTAEKR